MVKQCRFNYMKMQAEVLFAKGRRITIIFHVNFIFVFNLPIQTNRRKLQREDRLYKKVCDILWAIRG